MVKKENDVGKYNDNKWIGQRFGKLTVIKPEHVVLSNGGQEWHWLCRCDCGTEKIVKPFRALNGRQVSCGCYRKENAGKASITHGESHTKLHNTWLGMRRRCEKPSDSAYSRYGGRGIKVCDEWQDYSVFAAWARENGYSESLSIERKDVNSGYAPDNCTWIPQPKQARNRTTTFRVTYRGKEMSLAEASELAGLPYKQVHYRIKRRGWPVEKALSVPIRESGMLRERCERAGVNYRTVTNRIYSLGWTEERAINTPTLGRGANHMSYNRT